LHPLPCIAATLLVVGCTTTTVFSPVAPGALPARHNARVGAVYAGAARAAEYTGPFFRVPFGAASVDRLDQAFAAMFSSNQRLPDWPPWRSTQPVVDGVVEVDAISMVVETGNDAGNGILLLLGGLGGGPVPDEVTIRYHACLHHPSGEVIGCWEATSHEKNQRGLLDSLPKSVAKIADRAMSHATASLVLSMESDPAVKAWLGSLSKTGP
jgi:hypothetical protein